MSIRIYKASNENDLIILDEIVEDCWVRIYDPTLEEQKELSEQQNIPFDFIHDPLDLNEGARTENKNKCTLIIIRSPYKRQDGDSEPGLFETIPYGIILKGNTIYTISKHRIKILSDYVKKCNNEVTFKNKKKIVLKLLQYSSYLYLDALKKIDDKHQEIEKNMLETVDNNNLVVLQGLKKSLVYFTTSIKSNIVALNKLKRNGDIIFNEEDLDILEDVWIDLKQAQDLSEIYTNIIVGTMNTYTSIISNDISNVMKVLTSFTIILMIPTLISSIYGMNIQGLPFADNPHAFKILMIFSFFISGIGTFLFFNKTWIKNK